MIVWIIGMSGAGKTVIGREVYKRMKPSLDNLVFLDGDDFREIFRNDLGHDIEGRKMNADRICRMCKFFDDNNINVICSILSIFEESRTWNREHYKDYKEIFIDVSFEELVRRDSKDLYKKALAGEIRNVVGVDIDFEEPLSPDLLVKNEGDESIEDIASRILEKIKPV